MVSPAKELEVGRVITSGTAGTQAVDMVDLQGTAGLGAGAAAMIAAGLAVVVLFGSVRNVVDPEAAPFLVIASGGRGAAL
jgi:hypothetical protein